MSIPEKLVCELCGSSNTSRSRYARWDIDTQKWEVTDLSDYTWCSACDNEITGEWLPLELKDMAKFAIKKENEDGIPK